MAFVLSNYLDSRYIEAHLQNVLKSRDYLELSRFREISSAQKILVLFSLTSKDFFKKSLKARPEGLSNVNEAI